MVVFELPQPKGWGNSLDFLTSIVNRQLKKSIGNRKSYLPAGRRPIVNYLSAPAPQKMI
jgi:hypothetical protein